MVRALTNKQGEFISESAEMCEAFQEHVTQIFRWNCRKQIRRGITDLLADLMRLLMQDTEIWKGPITTGEVIKTMVECSTCKTLELDD